MKLTKLDPKLFLGQGRNSLVVVEPEQFRLDRLEQVRKDLEPVVQPETREIFNRLPGYKWARPQNRLNALHNFQGLVVSHYNRLPEQRKENENGFIFWSNLDQSENLIPVIRQAGSETGKIFAVTEGVAGGDGAVIGGPEFDWRLEKLDVSRAKLPAQATQILSRIRAQGIEFPRYYLAEPNGSKGEVIESVLAQETAILVNKFLLASQAIARTVLDTGKRIKDEFKKEMEAMKEQRKMNFKPYKHRDPALLASFGSLFHFYLELCRWE